ncbi:carbohydrate-binding module family 13 protein [Calocera cornea HHB12733]|uniref:Carbohydrate-binding module family 13 protein n=1 Tax=Calocera cornea HHB12733 TaxID=1353952 RepID=A0A165CRI9_9BASI|nr:carbohydrate-binding module family 13 protein [Calocera cornea HHB12733]
MSDSTLSPVDKFPVLPKPVVIADGTYAIINVASGTALKVQGTQYIWTILYDQTKRAYELANKDSGTYITASQLYTPLVLGQTEIFQATLAQVGYFTLHISNTTGAYAISPAGTNKVVELFQGSSAPGTAVQITDADGSTKQLWSFVRIPN